MIYIVGCSNLDETTRSVYKENVRINEALQYHMEEGDKLKTIKERLQTQNEELEGEKELNTMVIKEKVSQSKQQKSKIKEVSSCIVFSIKTQLSLEYYYYYHVIILHCCHCDNIFP